MVNIDFAANHESYSTYYAMLLKKLHFQVAILPYLLFSTSEF